MPTATVNGVELNYEMMGRGPVMGSIHGGFGGAGSSVLPREEPWASAFIGAYTLVTYDRRSAGRSTYGDGPHTLAAFAGDLRELLRHLRIERAFIMGSSAGGPIAITYALTYPETVAGLILHNTSAHVLQDLGPSFVQGIKRRMDYLKANGSEKTFDLIQQEQAGQSALVLAGRGGPQPPERAQAVAERQKQTQAAVAKLSRDERVRFGMGELRNYSAYLDVDLRPRLKEIKAPTLVVHGDADTLVPPSSGKELAESISGAELALIPGAGHGITNWKGAQEATRKFLDKHATATARR